MRFSGLTQPGNLTSLFNRWIVIASRVSSLERAEVARLIFEYQP